MPGFSDRMGLCPEEESRELVEEVPSYVRIALRDKVVALVTYIDRDSRYWQARPVGIKEFIEELSYLRRQDPPSDYEDSWRCAEILHGALEGLTWNEYYDALEWMAKKVLASSSVFPEGNICNFPSLRGEVNKILVRVNAAWTLDGSGEFVRRLDPESSAVESAALQDAEDLEPVKVHLKKARRYLDARPCDAANSIKESVSAVESRGKILYSGVATLGDVIAKLRRRTDVPQGISNVIEKYYAFANQEPGVRHGGVTAERVTSREADLCYCVALGLVRYLSAVAAETVVGK